MRPGRFRFCQRAGLAKLPSWEFAWHSVRNAIILEACVVLDLLEVDTDSDLLILRPECANAQYLLSHLFGVPTKIRGFDALFGGGGLMLADSSQEGVQQPAHRLVCVTGRTILCIGPCGSGKSLLSLQSAVQVARKGGIAWVIALEQSPEECLFSLESIGINTRDSSFTTATGLADSFAVFKETVPSKGALVFMRLDNHAVEGTHFLKSVADGLGWMRNFPLRLLVIDPVSALLLPDKSELQTQSATRGLFEAAKRLNVNLWLTGEQSETTDGQAYGFARNIADTIIRLGFEGSLGHQRRFIEIAKSRYQEASFRRHGLTIGSQEGMCIYPSGTAFD